MVCISYDFKAALKMAWKREEVVDVDGVWDMTTVGDFGSTDQVTGR